jgi:hypothetical protein
MKKKRYHCGKIYFKIQKKGPLSILTYFTEKNSPTEKRQGYFAFNIKKAGYLLCFYRFDRIHLFFNVDIIIVSKKLNVVISQRFIRKISIVLHFFHFL